MGIFSHKFLQGREMKKFLHVGCGPKNKEQTTVVFNSDEWEEVRLDIDESVKPDIIASLNDLSVIDDGSYDAIFSSHNIEHLFPHEVDIALKEFNRVLNKNGYLLITCPDLKAVAKFVAEDKLLDILYESPAGPITPLDVLFGHRASLQQGNLYMAHKCGFTRSVLLGLMSTAGFKALTGAERPNTFDLWAIGTKNDELLPADTADMLKEHLNITDDTNVTYD